MGRWTQYDEDSYRLPEGMKRIGYDADTGQYLFEDNTGTYKGLPGSYYGHMYPADAPEPPQRIPVAQARSPSVEPRLPSPEVESSTRLRKAMRRATLPSMPTALRNLRRSLTTVRKPWHRDRSSDDDQAVQTSSVESKPLRSADNAHSTAAVTRGSKSAPSAPWSSTTSRTLVSTECKSPAPSSTFSASSKHPNARPTAALARESKIPASSSTGAAKVPKGAAPSRSATISTSRRSEVDSGHTRRAASDHAFTVRDSPILKRAVTVDASSKSKSTSPSKSTSTSKPLVLSSTPSKQTSASLGAAATSVQKIPSSRRQGSTSQVSSPVSVSAASPPASARPRRAASSASPRTTRPEATRTSRTMALALAAT
ncbi:hypothetical protein C8J57DRAFT_1368167 [Mycena rebaudengoi]|nr:hypothetical protein C8J57DRAFT_1368167 [Mycena rebaudengoi]